MSINQRGNENRRVENRAPNRISRGGGMRVELRETELLERWKDGGVVDGAHRWTVGHKEKGMVLGEAVVPVERVSTGERESASVWRVQRWLSLIATERFSPLHCAYKERSLAAKSCQRGALKNSANNIERVVSRIVASSSCRPPILTLSLFLSIYLFVTVCLRR